MDKMVTRGRLSIHLQEAPKLSKEWGEGQSRLSGHEPDVDFPIVFSGLRPGEKLFEELLGAEEGAEPTANARIFKARNPTVRPDEETFPKIEKLINGCRDGSDTWRLVREAECGLRINPEAPQALAKAILDLYKDRELGVRMGLSGRRFVEKNFSREKIARQYEQLFTRVIGRGA